MAKIMAQQSSNQAATWRRALSVRLSGSPLIVFVIPSKSRIVADVSVLFCPRRTALGETAAGGRREIDSVIARNLLILIIAVAVFWLTAQYLLPPAGRVAPRPAVEFVPESAAPQPEAAENLLADISLHTVEELDLLFDRVEQLLERPRGEGEQPLVSLVLHGDEVRFFALQNYTEYKSIVDRAAKLAALGAVDISICQTQMKNFGIAPDEVPAFLHQVPYGPGEVRRLLDEGYVSM